MNNKPVFLIAMVGLLTSCFGPAHKLMPGYGKAEFANRRLGIILIKDNIRIGNEDDVRLVLGNGDAAEVFYGLFSAEFPRDIKAASRFTSACFCSGADNVIVSARSRNPEAFSDVSVVLPKGKRFISDTIDYFMVIDQLNLTRQQNSGSPVQGSEGMFQGITGGMDNLACSASFAVWDNRAGTVAAYGQIREKVPVAGNLTKETFCELLKSVARALCSGMPY